MKRFLALVLTASFVCCSFTAFAEEQVNRNAVNAFNDILDITESTYYKDITREQLLQSAVEGLLEENPELIDALAKNAYDVLDENSVYLTEEEYTDRIENVTGEFCGIGVAISYFNSKCIITKVYKNTPSIAAGLKEGDIIVAVDGEDVTSYGLEKVVSLVRGEKGTNVLLTVLRNGVEMYFTVSRAVVNIPSVEYEKLEKNNSGYIRVDSFGTNTFNEFNEALGKLAAEGVDKIILDLRNNTGGILNAAVKMAYTFVPEGKTIVTEDYKVDKYDKTYYSVGNHKRMKVVVLVNEYSASASEALAGAIQDNKAGVIVGTKTYGKGTVQTTWDLAFAGAIWLTIAQYNLPKGENIHGIGITPDYVVENTTKAVDLSGFTPITKEKVLQYGDVGPQVLALKQHISAIGFEFMNMDDKYDDELVSAVTSLQAATGLYPYGVADFTTQAKISEKAQEATEVVDSQLIKAKELIFNMK